MRDISSTTVSSPCQGVGQGILRAHALIQVQPDQLRNHLGVGFRLEFYSLVLQLLLQVVRVVVGGGVDVRNAVGLLGVGMRIVVGFTAVGCPASVPDAGVVTNVICCVLLHQIDTIACSVTGCILSDQ
jgi:hypothetical protein